MGLDSRAVRGLIKMLEKSSHCGELDLSISSGFRSTPFPRPMKVESSHAPAARASLAKDESFEDDGTPYGEIRGKRASAVLPDEVRLIGTPTGKSGYFDSLKAARTTKDDGVWRAECMAISTRSEDFAKEFLTEPTPRSKITEAEILDATAGVMRREAEQREARRLEAIEKREAKAEITHHQKVAVQKALADFPSELDTSLNEKVRAYAPRWEQLLEDCLHRTNFRRYEADYRRHSHYVSRIEGLLDRWSMELTNEWMRHIQATIEARTKTAAEVAAVDALNSLTNFGASMGNAASSIAGITAVFGMLAAATGAPRNDAPDALPDDFLESLSEGSDERRGSW